MRSWTMLDGWTREALARRRTRRAVAAVLIGTTCGALVVTLAVPAQAADTARMTGHTPAAAQPANGRPKPTRPDNNHYAGLSATEKAELKAAAAAAAAPSGKRFEDLAARSGNSRTTVDPSTGTRITQVSPVPLNYRDAEGKWRPVDSSLESLPAGKGWRNAAAGYSATLPSDLSDPVTVTDANDAERWVSVQLLEPAARAGAAVTASPTAPVPAPLVDALGRAAHDTATYVEAMSGVDVALEAQPSGVKETLTLASPAATRSWSYAVSAAPGLTVTAAHDVVRVKNAAGKTVFLLPAPFMDDAKGAHSEDVDVTLKPGTKAGESVATVTPSASWLNDATRAWPVVVDPTIEYPADILGCGISSAAPSSAACGSNQLPISWDSSTGAQQRTLLKYPTLFDVLPADAQIARAQLKVGVVPTSGASTTDVDVRELSASFSSGATWSTRDGSASWATAGGDRGATVARTTVDPAAGGYFTFDVAATVQGWLEGTSTYNGFELEKASATSGGAPVRLTDANDTSLYVEWSPRAGNRKGNSAVVDLDLDDATSVAVNPATGNAMVTTRQLKIAGVGLDLNVAHTSNSLAPTLLGVDGVGWVDSLSGVGLQPYGSTLFYRDASGAEWTFYQALDGSWTRPVGLDVDLVHNSDGSYTITERKSKVAQRFTDIGDTGDPFYGLSKVTDRNGNCITFTYDSTARLDYNGHLILRTVTDTRGRDLSITNYGYFNSWVTDVTDRTPTTTVTDNQLVSEDNAAGGTTTYEYDADDRVSAVVVPEGQRTEFTYDSDGRILTLKRVSTAENDPTWTFSYGEFDRSGGAPATQTAVTDPNGHTTTYKSDGRGRVGSVTDARGKKRDTTYTANDDAATTTGATAGSGSSAQTRTNSYDSAGGNAAATWNLTATRIPTGAGIANTYGSGARLYDLATSTDARGTTTNYAYDSAGNQTSVTRGGTTTKNLYQGDTDPDYGGTVNCGPTVSGSITATKAGVLCENRDGDYTPGTSAATTTAHRTTYRYDTLGQLTNLTPGTPSAQQPQSFVYDDLSRLAATTDGRGQTTYYGYDAMDRLTYTLYQDGRVVSTYFGNESGNGWLRAVDEYPANSSTPDRHTDYARDDLGRLRATVSPEDTINLDYDELGLLTGYNDAGGSVAYGYNDANQLTSLALPGGSCSGQSLASPGAASTKCVLFGVDDDGRRTMTRYPGGQTLETKLDDAGRLKQVIGTTLAGSTSTQRLNLSYSYTDSGAPATSGNPNKDTSLVTSVVDAAAARTTSYSHDSLDRLTVASTAPTGGGAVTRYEGFCYDAAGNRTKYLNSSSTSCSSGTAAATFTYNGGNELTAASGVTPTGASLAGSGFSYDGNGNQTSAKSAVGVATAYGTQEQASSFTPAGGSAVAQSYAATSGGNGERVKSGAGATGTSFGVSPLSPAPAWSKTGTTSKWTVRDPDGNLVAVRIGTSPSTATAYYPFVDNVGSVRNLVKADGTLANSYTYSAYGTTLTTSEASGASQPYRYGGGYTDTTTGLIKLGIRYYDPAQARFTQHDPTGQDAQYVYAHGCAVTYNDPSGAGPIDDAYRVLNSYLECVALQEIYAVRYFPAIVTCEEHQTKSGASVYYIQVIEF